MLSLGAATGGDVDVPKAHRAEVAKPSRPQMGLIELRHWSPEMGTTRGGV